MAKVAHDQLRSGGKETLQKAQQTQGLSFAYQNNFFLQAESNNWLPLSVVSDSQTDSLLFLVDLTEVTLAFEDANSKLLGLC